jgi:hypothetical protein
MKRPRNGNDNLTVETALLFHVLIYNNIDDLIKYYDSKILRGQLLPLKMCLALLLFLSFAILKI